MAEPCVCSPRKTSDGAAPAQVDISLITEQPYPDWFCAGVFICAPWISVGDVLYEILQCVKQQRRSIVCEPLNASPSLGTQGIQSPGSCQMPTNSVSEPQPPTVNDTPGQ